MTEYERGRSDFDDGVKRCPYGQRGDNRITTWWNGWLDIRTENRFGWTRAEWGDQNQIQRGRQSALEPEQI